MTEINGEFVEFVRSSLPVNGGSQAARPIGRNQHFPGNSQDRCDRAETGNCAYTKNATKPLFVVP